MSRYDGKTALITGGASGIGLVTARMLVDEGARVLLTGRTQATLDAAKRELGDAATVIVSDAALPERHHRARRAHADCGR